MGDIENHSDIDGSGGTEILKMPKPLKNLKILELTKKHFYNFKIPSVYGIETPQWKVGVHLKPRQITLRKQSC